MSLGDWTLRLAVMTRRRRLDAMIASGHDVATDRRLALRAAQLTERGSRLGIAAGLSDALASAYERPRDFCARVPVRLYVRACDVELRALIEALTNAPAARGVAIARELLLDGTSPLYKAGDAERLRWAIQSARVQMGRS
jgi:hypothetical protein